MEIKDSKTLYADFEALTVKELEEALLSAKSHEERAFYRALVNLKLQISQEKIIGKALL